MNSIHQNSSIQRVASPDGRGYCGLRQYRYDRPRTPATEKRTNKLLIKNPPKVSGGSGTLKLLNFAYAFYANHDVKVKSVKSIVLAVALRQQF